MTTEQDVGVALSIIQRTRKDDEPKSLYLSLRACYLGEKESARIAGININTLETWREEDPLFYRAEVQNLAEFQEIAHRQALRIEYVRNYRLVLVKDIEVLFKSLDPNEELTNAETQYLNKMRGSYTPEGLDKLTRMASGKGGSGLDELLTFVEERQVIISQRRELSHGHKDGEGNIPRTDSIDSPGDLECIVDAGEG